MTAYAEIPITPDVLTSVLSRLWARGTEELIRCGLTVGDCYQSFMEWSKQGRSGALTADSVPVFVGGIYPEDDGTAFTWMQCTHEFDAHYRAIIRTMRRALRTYPEPVYIFSVCVHPDAEKFFKVLGFERDGWVGCTPVGYPLHRFARR